MISCRTFFISLGLIVSGTPYAQGMQKELPVTQDQSAKKQKKITLIQAIKDRDIKKIDEILISDPTALNKRDDNNIHPLLHAVNAEHVTMVERMLSSRVAIPSKTITDAFLCACAIAHEPLIKFFLGKYPNLVRASGSIKSLATLRPLLNGAYLSDPNLSCLEAAIYSGRIELVNDLMYKADPLFIPDEEVLLRCCHIAFMKAHEEMALWLLKMVNPCNVSEPLMYVYVCQCQEKKLDKVMLHLAQEIFPPLPIHLKEYLLMVCAFKGYLPYLEIMRKGYGEKQADQWIYHGALYGGQADIISHVADRKNYALDSVIYESVFLPTHITFRTMDRSTPLLALKVGLKRLEKVPHILDAYVRSLKKLLSLQVIQEKITLGLIVTTLNEGNIPYAQLLVKSSQINMNETYINGKTIFEGCLESPHDFPLNDRNIIFLLEECHVFLPFPLPNLAQKPNLLSLIKNEQIRRDAQLFKACKENDSSFIEHYATNCASRNPMSVIKAADVPQIAHHSPEFLHELGLNIILWAAVNNKEVAMKALLHHNFSPHFLQNMDGCEKMSKVLLTYDLKEIITIFIEHFSQKNHTNPIPLDALMVHSIMQDKVAYVKMLFDAGYPSHKNLPCKVIENIPYAFLTKEMILFGKTPLHLAVARGSVACVRALIEKGADLFARNNQNKTVFDWENLSPEMVELLEQIKTEKQQDFDSIWPSICHNGEIAPSYLKAVDAQGRTLLIKAVQEKNKDLVVKLLHKSVALEKQDLVGKTALYHAVELKHLDIAKHLIFAGANPVFDLLPNNHETAMSTPLRLLAFHNHSALLHEMIQHTSSLDNKMCWTNEAIYCASRGGHLLLTKSLIDTYQTLLLAKDGEDQKWHIFYLFDFLVNVGRSKAMVSYAYQKMLRDKQAVDAEINALMVDANTKLRLRNYLECLFVELCVNYGEKAAEKRLYWLLPLFYRHLDVGNDINDFCIQGFKDWFSENCIAYSNMHHTKNKHSLLAYHDAFEMQKLTQTWREAPCKEFVSNPMAACTNFEQAYGAFKATFSKPAEIEWPERYEEFKNQIITSQSKQTLLMWACIFDFPDTVKKLVRMGLPRKFINEQDCYGRTALMYALLYGNFECALALIADQKERWGPLINHCGTGIYLKDTQDKTAFYYAALSGRFDEKQLEQAPNGSYREIDAITKSTEGGAFKIITRLRDLHAQQAPGNRMPLLPCALKMTLLQDLAEAGCVHVIARLLGKEVFGAFVDEKTKQFYEGVATTFHN